MQNPKIDTSLLIKMPISKKISESINALSLGYLEPNDSILEKLQSKAQTLYDVYKLSKSLVKSKNIRHKLLGRSYGIFVMRLTCRENIVITHPQKRQNTRRFSEKSPKKLFERFAGTETSTSSKIRSVTLKVLNKNFSEKDFQSFIELTQSAGKKVCREVDLPYAPDEILDWKEEVKNGNRTIIIAMRDNKPVGTLSIVPGSLPVVRVINGNLDNKITAIAGYDITAEFVLPEYRRQGICRKMEERADEIVTEKAAQGEMVYKSISTGMRAYEIMDSVLSDLMEMPKEEIENTPTVILFKMYADLDGKKLTEEHLKKMRYVIDKIDINPSATAIRILLDEKVKNGKAEFVGHSVDGAEPVYIIKG